MTAMLAIGRHAPMRRRGLECTVRHNVSWPYGGEKEVRLLKHSADHYWRHPVVIDRLKNTLGTASTAQPAKP